VLVANFEKRKENICQNSKLDSGYNLGKNLSRKKCYEHSDTNNFYFILFYFSDFTFLFLLFSWKDNEEGT